MRKLAAILVLAFATTMVMAQTPDDYKTNQSGAQKITNGPVIEYTSDHSAMIAWSTKYPAGTYLAYGTDQNNLSQRTEKAWGGTNHRLEIKNLQPSTTYYFQVRSEDASGKNAMGADVESPVASFSTLAKGAAPDRANRNVGINGGNATTTSTSGMNAPANLQLEPMYRLRGGNDHMYTTGSSERSSLISGGTYHDEGIAGYLATTQVSGTVPFFRMYSDRMKDHFYTANPGERQSAMGMGYRDESTIGYIAQSQLPGTVPLYRLRATTTGDHFYTTNQSEAQTAQQQGYVSEGIAGYVWSQQQ